MIHDFGTFKEIAAQEGVQIAVVAVPAAAAQDVIDQLVDAGIKAVLNYAPKSAMAPPEVRIRNVDPVVALQSMTYYLSAVR